MIDRAAVGLDNEPDHSHPFQIPGMADLMQLSRALGGGSYPGLGAGQNDSLGFPDSIAPGFPLNIPFVIPGNLVKQQAYKLSFIPAPYRQYTIGGASGPPAAAHSHGGDTISTLSITIVAGTGHRHRLFSTSAGAPAPVKPFNYQNASSSNKLVGLAADALEDIWSDTNTDASTAGGSDGHSHSNTAHSHTPGTTGGEASHTHTGGGSSGGVTEGTSPDAMRVIVDGVDATTQLGGPWTSQQFELDVTPFVGPGSGIHTAQVLSATQLGRVTGWVRQSNIVNPIAP